VSRSCFLVIYMNETVLNPYKYCLPKSTNTWNVTLAINISERREILCIYEYKQNGISKKPLLLVSYHHQSNQRFDFILRFLMDIEIIQQIRPLGIDDGVNRGSTSTTPKKVLRID
jgi:hypothetical protein